MAPAPENLAGNADEATILASFTFSFDKKTLVPWTLVPVKSKLTVQKICDGLLNDMLGNEIPTENNPAINTTLNIRCICCVLCQVCMQYLHFTLLFQNIGR